MINNQDAIKICEVIKICIKEDGDVIPRTLEDCKEIIQAMEIAIMGISKMETALDVNKMRECKHAIGGKVNEIGEILLFCELTDNLENITLGSCIGNCESQEK